MLMERLCKYIYAKDRTDRIRTCAILCHIYHHALHSRWYQARDLMLMSHLQDNIQHADPPVQVGWERGALAPVAKGRPGQAPVWRQNGSARLVTSLAGEDVSGRLVLPRCQHSLIPLHISILFPILTPLESSGMELWVQLTFFIPTACLVQSIRRALILIGGER